MDFPSKLYVKVIETGEEAYLGGYSVTDLTSLVYARAFVFKAGSATGQLRLNVYGDSKRTEVLATSEWSDLASIEEFAGGDWLGRVRFTFANLNLSNNHQVYVTCETSGYTRNGNTDYLSLLFDWPLSTNVQTNSPQAGLALELYGKEA